jgi:sigma-E factor negative regulatory protein RseA
MSEQIREQVSAFLDGELPNSETELLLKRLTRDGELRESFGRYALIGETIRGATRAPLSRGFAARVNGAIDGEAGAANLTPIRAPAARWWKTAAGGAVAAGVAVVAIVALQQRAVGPGVRAAAPVTAQNAGAAHAREAFRYTVPAAIPDAPAVLSAARLTSYVFAHSKYSSGLGQSNVLSGLLADADEVPLSDKANGSAVKSVPADAAAAGAAPSAQKVQRVAP